ncbi:MAG: trehalose-phosphatase [Candidatus Dormibacterales bacterium]
MTPQVTHATSLAGRFLAGVDPSGVLLATDFDGTLAEITHDPGSAAARPGAAEALAFLAGRLRAVAVISGRSREALARLLPGPGLTLRGDYGLEAPTSAEKAALSSFNAEAERALAGTEGVVLERKAGSTSVHFRAAPALGPRLLEVAAAIAESRGLRAGRGRMVVEVRPARASKGAALAALIDELEPAAVIFAGDDEGDREAFQLVARLGLPHLALGVGSPEAPAGLFDACDAVLRGPAQMEEFLRWLSRWAAPRGRAGPAAGS